MFKPVRLIATIIYLVALGLTLYVAFEVAPLCCVCAEVVCVEPLVFGSATVVLGAGPPTRPRYSVHGLPVVCHDLVLRVLHPLRYAQQKLKQPKKLLGGPKLSVCLCLSCLIRALCMCVI